MNKKQIENRISQLRSVIAFSRIHKGALSTGECILCNQEISALYSIQDYPGVLRFKVSTHLNSKIQKLSDHIQKINWEKPDDQNKY